MKKKLNIQCLNRVSIILLALFFSLSAIKVSSQSNPFLSGNGRGISPYGNSKKSVLIVFDASGSMDETINGETKIHIAKRVLEKVLQEADTTLNIGLRVYGSSAITSSPKVNCSDTRLLVPPNVNNRRSIIQAVDRILPNGLTPITYSLVQAIRDLNRYQGDKSIVLISDGLETCGYDPCILAGRMKKHDIDIMIDVVGFGLKNDYSALKQLKCIALSTHGKFFSANTAAELASGLADSFNTNVSGRVITDFVPTQTDTTQHLKTLPKIESEHIDVSMIKK